jgi:hypothetical protein
MSDHKYRVTYTITPHPEGITKEQIPEGAGACDCVMFFSVIGVPGDGKSLSVVTASLNGERAQPLSPEQQFQLWALWAHDLTQKMTPSARRDLASAVHNAIREVALKDRTDLPERIEKAAIRHADGTVFDVPRPGRHHDVIRIMRMAGKPWKSPDEALHVQGFVTSTGRFVDRVEAKKIATAANQLLERESGKTELFSEDVW